MGRALIDFLITLVGLIFVGAMIFMAIDFISTDERFKKIGKFAVGGIIVILFLFAIKGVLFGGGTAMITPLAMLYFAIAVIVILVVWFLIDWFLGWAATFFPPIGQFMQVIKFVVGAVVLVAILISAADLLLGGGTGAGRIFSNMEPPPQNRDLAR
jgi:hypothetical protein